MLELNKKYRIIYADPPWKYNDDMEFKKYRPNPAGAESHYKCMTIDEIKSLPIKNIANKDSCLFLWATVPLLPEALEVLNEWGYRYKTSIFWRKIMSLGMGYWFRGQVEVLLFGIKGKVKAFRCQKANVIQTKVRKHSQKPDEVYVIIEEISQKFNLNPKIELFARHKREGWDVWGNEVPKDTQKILRK